MKKRHFWTKETIEPSELEVELEKIMMFGGFQKHEANGVTVMVMERLYFRTKSDASCTVITYKSERGTEVIAISGGAGVGFWGFSWGASDNFIKNVEKAIERICRDRDTQEYNRQFKQ